MKRASEPNFSCHHAVRRLIRCGALALALLTATVATASAGDQDRVALPGHVLDVVSPSGAAIAAPKSAAADTQSLTLTVVLRRDDEPGFQRYLHDVYDAQSPSFRHFLAPSAIAQRFGPSVENYAQVRDYLASRHVEVTAASNNRMTLDVSGSRSDVERAFGVHLGDYRIDDKTFFANDADPSLPPEIAAHVQAVAGLTDLGAPAPNKKKYPKTWAVFCGAPATAAGAGGATAGGAALIGYSGSILGIIGTFAAAEWSLLCYLDTTDFSGAWAEYNAWMQANSLRDDPHNASTARLADGTGQTVGLLEFDTFQTSDVADFLDYVGQPAGSIERLGSVHVNGGASAGANQDEVLLDIDTVMSLAPGAHVVVYDAPFNGRLTSYATLFNAMINDSVTVISNSWSSCEDQVSLADAQGIDSILQSAAASGISVFNGAGDSGSTCLDGAANTIGVPADSPNATAVGGTTLRLGAGFTYASETWWNGSNDVPATGSGGYGVSRYFARPSYQDGHTAASMRSIPDVAIDADPATGMPLCIDSDGGCPNGSLYGGTSLAAPEWAAYAALLNDAVGTNLGALNPQFYPLANSHGFHDAGSMGTDFAHVGLGSPNVNPLYLALTGQTSGLPSSTLSKVIPLGPTDLLFVIGASPSFVNIPADGVTSGGVLVRLRDADGNSVSGKTVTLAANAGSHAVISPASGVSDISNGAVVFTFVDNTIESLSFTATDVTDGIVLTDAADVAFVSPSAASGGIMAFPTAVVPDGVSTTSITITLHDANNHPSPGKQVTLAQTGRSVVVAPQPALTDSNGQIVFSATDAFEESVTYTAVDETDGELPIPGIATVDFSGAAAGSCVLAPEIIGSDYSLVSFANGFAAYPFFYGNTNFACAGASDAAFDTQGNAYIAHGPTGNLYKFGPDGGAATTPLSTLGPTLHQPLFDTDGRLYAAHTATTGDFRTGDIVEIDPATGAQLRVVAANLTCPNGLAFDPISGDLFFDDNCSGAGSDNPSVFRLIDPSGTDPNRPTAVTVYAALPSTPNGMLSFSPDGTLYAATAYGDCQHSPLIAVSASDGPSPPTTTTLTNVDSCFWVRVGAADVDGAARSLVVFNPDATGFFLNLVDITTTPVTQTPLARNLGSGTIGKDGCLYSSSSDTTYKFVPTSGTCDFATTNPSPTLDLTPGTVVPNPQQGSTLTLTATLRNIVAPADTPLFVQIGGANAQTRLLHIEADGSATFDFQGMFEGDDIVIASATIGATTLTSNPARVHWNAGAHTSFVNIDGVTSGPAGSPIALHASLSDVSLQPHAGIGGSPIAFAVDGQTCSASTDAQGAATCSVTLASPGVFTLTATYAGSAQYLAASQSTLFYVSGGRPDRIFADGFETH